MDQQSSDKDQTTATTDQNGMSTLNGGRGMTETGHHDQEDEDKTASELDYSGVQATDGLTTTNDVDCQQSDISHPVLPRQKNSLL